MITLILGFTSCDTYFVLTIIVHQIIIVILDSSNSSKFFLLCSLYTCVYICPIVYSGEQKNGGQTLLPRNTGNGSNVPFLGPSDPNIVPIQEMQQVGGEGAANPRFPMPLRSNTRKIYIQSFNSYLQDMLDDSGYKFSEEYEVS